MRRASLGRPYLDGRREVALLSGQQLAGNETKGSTEGGGPDSYLESKGCDRSGPKAKWSAIPFLLDSFTRYECRITPLLSE